MMREYQMVLLADKMVVLRRENREVGAAATTIARGRLATKVLSGTE